MELGYFGQTALDNITLYLTVFIILFLLYRFIFFKNTLVNVVDSFFIEALTSAGSCTTVFIMWHNNSIQDKFLFSFITTELALFLGINYIFFIYSKNQKDTIPLFFNAFQKNYFKIFFLVTSFIFFVVQLLIIKSVGIILLTDDGSVNHVNAFEKFGLLFEVRLVITPIFATTLFAKRKLFGKFSFADYLLLVFLVLTCLGSGSKSSFMVLFTCYAFVEYKFSKLENKPLKKIPTKYLFFFGISILIIIVLTDFETENRGVFLKLFERILFSGDIFLLGYDDQAIRYVMQDNKNAVSFILYPLYGKIFKVLGLIDKTPTNIGVGLYDYTYGITTSGSTPRHNYLSLLFFGEKFSWILSLLIGLFIGYIRFVVFEFRNVKSITVTLFVIIVASIVPFCITDIYLFNMLLFMLIILFLVITTLSFFGMLLLYKNEEIVLTDSLLKNEL